MKKQGIINPALCAAVAAVGHTDRLVIADAGLPIPEGVEVIDLSLVPGTPTFLEVLRAVRDELVIEGYIAATELPDANPAVDQGIRELLPDLERQEVTHQMFKCLVGEARAVVRTGECTSFANVILVAGVNF